MGSDREDTTVKEMTAREILDAIRSGLEETSRRFAKRQPEQTRPLTDERADIIQGHESSDAAREKAKL
jgi:hypothetical protein